LTPIQDAGGARWTWQGCRWRGVPDKRLWPLVAAVEVIVDGLDGFRDLGEGDVSQPGFVGLRKNRVATLSQEELVWVTWKLKQRWRRSQRLTLGFCG